MKNLLCRLGLHKSILCYNGQTKGLAKVCLRSSCNWRKHIKSTRKSLLAYHKSLLKKKAINVTD